MRDLFAMLFNAMNQMWSYFSFNQLCLPDYETYEQFEKSLIIAITEGTEGFGLI